MLLDVSKVTDKYDEYKNQNLYDYVVGETKLRESLSSLKHELRNLIPVLKMIIKF